MRRVLIILSLILAGSVFIAWPTMALDQDDDNIKQSARDIRVQVAELDQQLREHLRKTLREYGERFVECGEDKSRKSLAECVEDDASDLTQTTITVATSGPNEDDFLGDLSDTEERFALFTDKMNRANDLLAHAGATLYMKSLDVAPEMDQLRRDVIIHVERKRAHDLRTKQAMLIATIVLVLMAIFSMIFMVIKRFR